jgi:hypothetical protein
MGLDVELSLMGGVIWGVGAARKMLQRVCRKVCIEPSMCRSGKVDGQRSRLDNVAKEGRYGQ